MFEGGLKLDKCGNSFTLPVELVIKTNTICISHISKEIFNVYEMKVS